MLFTVKLCENFIVTAYFYESYSRTVHLRFRCDPVKRTYHVITICKIRAKISYFRNMYKFCDNGLLFTLFLVQTNVQIGEQSDR